MNFKRILSIFIIIFIQISLVTNSISYSIEVNEGVINSRQSMNNPYDTKEKISNILISLEEIDINGIIRYSQDYTDDGYIESIEEIIVETTEIAEFNINGLQLREGISNEEVLRVKRFLIEKGYAGLEESYYFDLSTKNIVKEYQKNNGLNPDGIIGPKTFGQINEDMKANSINISNIEIELPNILPEKKWILINKESNTLYHYENRELINKYPIASGKTPSHTPEGKFTIIVKFVNPYWGGAGKYTPVKGGAPNNPLGKRWLGLSIQGGGTYGIHGNADVYSIGKHVSLGCIRMFNEDVEFLYDIIDYNTPVWIFSSMSEI